MHDRDPVSVLLPTHEWGAACEQVAAGLGPDDELLVICDTEDDPVASADPRAGVEIIVAGEPERCSGKANALAYGMERARHERFVWTDDDFERDPTWLDRLVAAGEAHGPASAIPFFTGGGWWRPVEPWYGALFTSLVYFGVGGASNVAWGGGVTFTRAELTVDVPTLVAELRGVLSDDYLLTQRLPGVYAVRSMLTHVDVPGDFGSVVHRLVRFTRIVGVNEGWGGLIPIALLAVVGVLYPLVVAPVLTVAFGVAYVGLGLKPRNGTFLFAYPCLLVFPLVLVVARTIDEFEWGGRRYRFAEDGGVEVLGRVKTASGDEA
jgi:hypothetical protein